MPALIISLGAGRVADLPLLAFRRIMDLPVGTVYAPPLDEALEAFLPVAIRPYDAATCPDDAVVVAPDPQAWRIASAFPGADTVPARELLRERAVGAGVGRLAGVGRELRLRCPWDREQVPETIVPHTVEEAFEVAEAFHGDDRARQVDEIGDLLFQSVFLARFLEEAGVADLGAIADIQADKLISRHPHVYGDVVAREAGDVVGLWERQKRDARGGEIFHEVPVGLPALAFGAKMQKRAAAVGFEYPDADAALAKLREEVAELDADRSADELGDVIFAAVSVARALSVDPELAVRRSAATFRDRVTRAAALARADGHAFESLGPAEQLAYYSRAKAGGP